MTKNPLVFLFSGCMTISLLLVSCGTAQTAATPTLYPTPVKSTYTVQKGDIVINQDLFGRVTPLALSTVYFQMDGHVGDVYVQVNDAVTKGELLADLVELKTLETQTVETTDAIKRAQIALNIAKLELEKYQSDGASSYDVQIQEQQVELAQMDLDEVLIKNGIDPSSDYMSALNNSVDKAKVFAPMSGVIISGVNPGRSVTTTTVAFMIGDGSQSEILATIDPGKIADTLKNLFEGMPVIVSPNNDPTVKWDGKIRQLPSPYGTGSADDENVHVVLDQTPATGSLKSGDTVTVNIQIANKTGILWLPPAAIRVVGGRTFVIVNGDNGPKRIDIEIGLQTADRVEIISGLDEGQVVIGQ